METVRTGPKGWETEKDQEVIPWSAQKEAEVSPLKLGCAVLCLVAQSCTTLCDPLNCSLPGSSVHGILQGSILEWVAMPSSRDLPDPGIEPATLTLPALAVRFFTTVPCGKPKALGELTKKQAN